MNTNSHWRLITLASFAVVLTACDPKPPEPTNVVSSTPSTTVTSSSSDAIPVVKLHPSWDTDNNGINDCETDGSCDDTVDYTKGRPFSKMNPQALQEYYQATSRVGPVNFSCSDNPQLLLIATFYATEPAIVVLERDNSAIELQSVPAASGSKYEGSGTLFWEHQGEAKVILGENTPELVCKKSEPPAQ